MSEVSEPVRTAELHFGLDGIKLIFMNAVEFTTELNESRTLQIPQEVARELPRSGMARIILLTAESDEDKAWQSLAYQQFLRDDAPEDAVYDSPAAR